MVISVQELKAIRDKKAADEAAEKAKREEENALWLKRKAAEDIVVAEGLLEGRLGELIKECNDRNMTFLAITSYPSKEEVSFGGACQYNHSFKVGFRLDPEYKATKVLIASLMSAGFLVRLSTKNVQNTEIIPYGDGEYNVIDAPGTHPVYTLYISWLV